MFNTEQVFVAHEDGSKQDQEMQVVQMVKIEQPVDVIYSDLPLKEQTQLF